MGTGSGGVHPTSRGSVSSKGAGEAFHPRDPCPLFTASSFNPPQNAFTGISFNPQITFYDTVAFLSLPMPIHRAGGQDAASVR